MGDSSEILSAVALAIALIALGISLGQLLQQLFSTAEGYRKCQASVIGPWAKKTRLRWRWTQFRFETMLTTPEILLVPLRQDEMVWSEFLDVLRPHNRDSSMEEDFPQSYTRFGTRSQLGRRKVLHFITGSTESRQSTYSFQGDSESSELVGWIPFLYQLHILQDLSLNTSRVIQRGSEIDTQHEGSYNTSPSPGPMLSIPAIRFRERSWDFMPPEIVRPFASTTLGNIIAIAHRLGMIWRDLRPGDGILRAEGNGHTLSSTTVRSVGILLQYTFDDPVGKSGKSQAWRNVLVPTDDADKMGFGILPGCKELGVPDFVLTKEGGKGGDSLESTFEIMDILGLDQRAKNKVQESYNTSQYVEGFADIIGICAPFLPLRGSFIIQVLIPWRYALSSMAHPKCFSICRESLGHHLATYKDQGHQLQWISSAYDYLLGVHGIGWEAEIAHNHPRMNRCRNGCLVKRNHTFDTRPKSKSCLRDLQNYFDSTTVYFASLQETYIVDYKRFRYLDLVAAHINQAVDWKRAAEGKTIPKVVEFMRQRGFDDKQVATEAWFTMIFRAMLWHRGHYMTGPPPGVPSQYYGSKMPVYIGITFARYRVFQPRLSIIEVLQQRLHRVLRAR